MIDKTRTRRSVIKKLRELGLIFKAPTKKTNAAALNKNLWTHEQDDKLRQLYEEHRLNDQVLSIITGEFDGVRSKQAIVNRMVTIGLIADKSEVKPRKSRSKKTTENGEMSAEDLMSDENSEHEPDVPMKRTKVARPKASKEKTVVKQKRIPTKTSLNTKRLRNLLAEIEESMKEAVEWLVESFSEACEDYEGGSEDPDDGVPLVPIMPLQRDALENPQFRDLLKELGLAAPNENVSSLVLLIFNF